MDEADLVLFFIWFFFSLFWVVFVLFCFPEDNQFSKHGAELAEPLLKKKIKGEGGRGWDSEK